MLPPTGTFPLCHPQRRVWFSELLHPGTGVGNLAGCVHFPGASRELPALRDAIFRVVRRHDALHLRFVRGSGPLCEQLLGNPPEVEAPVWELGQDRGPLLEESRRPIDIFHGPPFAFRLLVLPGRIGYFFKYHHIAVDALSVALLNDRILRAFRGLPDADVIPSYLEFIERERRWLDCPERAQDEAFWREHLAGLEVVPFRETPIATRRWEHELDAELSARIDAFCKAQGTSVFRFFLAVFALFAGGWELPRDVVLATGHHNRMDAREKSMVGMTVSTLPIRLPVRAEESFAGLLARVHEVSAACLARQRYPFDLLARDLRVAGHNPRRLLSWFVNHVPSVPAAPDAPTVERYSPGADLAEINVKINPNQRPRTAPLELGVDARLALYGEADMDRLFARVEQLARQAVAEPDRPVAAMELVTSAERAALRRRAARPAPWPFATLWEGFQRAADLHPERTALVDAHGARTYARVRAESLSLAGEMVGRGVRPGDRVAILTGRSSEFAVAALAAARAGVAWVPLDPDSPPLRRERALSESSARLVLVDVPRPASVPTFVIGEHLDGSAYDGPAPGPADEAYVLFTSGSTGAPKGVRVHHGALARLLAWDSRVCDLSHADRCSAFCSFAFDVSVAELFSPLVQGASVYVVPEELRRGPVHDLGRWLDARAITVATLPTRVGELFRTHVSTSALRLLTVAGERLRRTARRPYRLRNAYGPTETTVYASAAELTGEEDDPPIGIPTDGLEAFVVDERLRLVGPYEVGELLLAGPQVALGYLDAGEHAGFVPNPFSSGPDDARAYRTGDRVRVGPDGVLHFVGRRDRQVKLRGFRVEPAEVERELVCHPAVSSCHVVVREEAGQVSLHAFCVCTQVSAGDLRAYLQERLPSWLVPETISQVPEIPLSLTGKTDEAALLALPAPKIAMAVAPRNPTEETFLRAFRAALHRPELGVTDDFFANGGDSLSAMHLFAEIERLLGRSLPVSLLFERPTVAALASALSGPPPDCVVALRPGPGPTLVCVHDLTGDLLSYGLVCRHLDPRIDVRGLRWSPTVGEEARTLEEVATRYLGFLRAAGLVSPWRLLGYSIGGTLAWEMARQARAQGDEVAFLGIVDTPNYARDAAVFDRLALTVAKNVLSFVRGFSVAFQVGYVGRLRLRGLVRALRRMRALGLGYRPGPLDRTLVLLRSRHERAGFGDDLGWKAIASSLSIYIVDGDHQSMMNERNAPTIARIVGERLASAEES